MYKGSEAEKPYIYTAPVTCPDSASDPYYTIRTKEICYSLLSKRDLLISLFLLLAKALISILTKLNYFAYFILNTLKNNNFKIYKGFYIIKKKKNFK